MLRQSLIDGNYQPQPVKGVKIPKPNVGERQLGIPTVVDRFVQQAIHQVLEPIFEPIFSNSSDGFRRQRSAHQAFEKASEYVAAGFEWGVDMDLEKYFDNVNHDLLMAKIARYVEDKRVLKLIRRFLQAGLMSEGVVIEKTTGTPQGGPLSPLLSNILLDEFDKELENRGHRFCRYADDCNIYVRSQATGERVLSSVKEFLDKRLKLKLNEQKSACARVNERQFLGYQLNRYGQLAIAQKSRPRIKEKIRAITKQNRGVKLEVVVKELNLFLRGGFNYYRLAQNRELMKNFDAWIRRRLRCLRLKQRKRRWPIARGLISLGIAPQKAWGLTKWTRGWWNMSNNSILWKAIPNQWFKEQGLFSLLDNFKRING